MFMPIVFGVVCGRLAALACKSGFRVWFASPFAGSAIDAKQVLRGSFSGITV
jgi:hypothetical protein